MNRPAARILMVAGEASGDLYGGLLVRALREARPGIEVTAIGGARMRSEGVTLLADASDLAVVGLVEVLSHWGAIRKAYAAAVDFLHRGNPELLVLIDYPDFNLRLARVARRRGVPVVYFISPQIWAWRASRIREIAERVDRMLVILPFEEAIYRSAGVPVEFVGHPLLDLLTPRMDRSAAKRRLGFDPERRVLGLLPGSRKREVKAHLPILLEAAALLERRVGNLQIALPLASTLAPEDLARYLPVEGDLSGRIRVLAEGTMSALGAMDAAVVKSGTATLEAALMGVPMVVVYRTNPATYLLASRLATVRRIGLVNIVAGKDLMPELIQSDCSPGKIADALEPLIRGGDRTEALREELMALRDRLGTPGCFRRSASSILNLLGEREAGREAPAVR